MNHLKPVNQRNELEQPALDVEAYRTFTIESDLLKSLSRNELEVYYQPRVDTSTNQIINAEALVRWNHPTWGQVSPSEFIPIAEKNGFIIPMGMWVLDTVCMQLRYWEANHFPSTKVSVNFSATQLLKPEIVHDVMRILHKNNIDPSLIEIEITENVLMHDKDLLQRVLIDFSLLGIHIALDDFGTGYSSLSYLLNFTINTIKIDRSFIKHLADNENNREITSAIIKLGQKLKLNLVAEGVETPEQLAILQRAQCNEIQGFLYSQAVPAQQFSELLRRGTLAPHSTINKAALIRQRKFFRLAFTQPTEATMTIVAINSVDVNVGTTIISLENIGPGGIRFQSHIKLPKKRGIVLGFETYLLGHSFKLHGQIVWSKETEENKYQYGVEFMITEEERAALTKVLNLLQIRMRRNII